MDHTTTQHTVAAVWRIEAPHIIARLVRLAGDVGLAEEAAQDALVEALARWPRVGVPENPGAWLMAAAKNRVLDQLRRQTTYQRKQDQLQLEGDTLQASAPPPPDEHPDTRVQDDLLRLILISCHPVLTPESRVALTLRRLGGLTTAEIARSVLITETTAAQRIVRAKKTLRDAGVPFEAPAGEDLAGRLDSVLEVLYLIFNEGYTATGGSEWMRPALAEEALRLGRVLAELAPNEAEVHGLVALMELQASRSRARVDAQGRPVLLLDQNRSRWDPLLIRRGLSALHRALSSETAAGVYTLQAAIAACHARARRPEHTNWPEISRLYGWLAQIAPSPVVELNRAVAISFVEGPAAGLTHLDPLTMLPSMASYHLLPSVRADFLCRLGRHDEARAEFERAASLTHNQRERELLLERADRCAAHVPV